MNRKVRQTTLAMPFSTVLPYYHLHHQSLLHLLPHLLQSNHLFLDEQKGTPNSFRNAVIYCTTILPSTPSFSSSPSSTPAAIQSSTSGWTERYAKQLEQCCYLLYCHPWEKLCCNLIIYFWINRKERQTTLAMTLSTVLLWRGKIMLQSNNLLLDV